MESFLDYEEQRSHDVKIRVIDSLTGRWSEAIVEVLVEDSNDHSPVFQQTFFNVSLSEASSIGTKILQVKTTDGDSVPNNGVSYHLENVDGSSVTNFWIHPNTGLVSLKHLLDREIINFHHLYVIATDTGSPPLSSSAQVVVTGGLTYILQGQAK